jgi:penicillin V acylase-like amidase (Ntn superfamily)
MKRAAFSVLAILLIFALLSNQALGCTTFCLRNGVDLLFGKNYDWMIGDGLIFVNKRGVHKEGTADRNAAKWLSTYGSVTFNQYGWENPSGGMNEAGLVIELMWLDDTEYPKAVDKPIVDVLEWIQYNLDTAATVDEVIKNSERLVISSRVKLHYLVSDARGNATTIEYLNGKLNARTGPHLPVAALTNDTYDRSLEYSKNADPSRTLGAGSLQRFARAAQRTKAFDKQPLTTSEAVAYAFETLGNVAQPGYTEWSIVYDQNHGRVHFRTLQSPSIKTIDTRAFDYACGGRLRMLDINAKTGGDVTPQFVDYTRAANRDLIGRAFAGTDFLRGVPAEELDTLATDPERFTCTGVKTKKVIGLARPDRRQNLLLALTFPLYYVYDRLSS